MEEDKDRTALVLEGSAAERKGPSKDPSMEEDSTRRACRGSTDLERRRELLKGRWDQVAEVRRLEGRVREGRRDRKSVV